VEAEFPAGFVVVVEEPPARALLVLDELGVLTELLLEDELTAGKVLFGEGMELLKLLLIVADGLPPAPFALVDDEDKTPAATVLEEDPPAAKVLLVLLKLLEDMFDVEEAEVEIPAPAEELVMRDCVVKLLKVLYSQCYFPARRRHIRRR
jgi:hypothetical protein